MRRKPKLNLDVDGVIADFAAAACQHLTTLTGKPHDPLAVTTWEVFDSFPDAVAHRAEVYRRMKGPGGCYAIPVVDGAKEAIAELREIADVTVVTAPFFGAPTWAYEREQWLGDHFGIHRDDIIHAEKKYLVHGDIMLDDKESHIVRWQSYWHEQEQYGARGLLWRTSRTINPAEGIEIMDSWTDVINYTKALNLNP